MVIIPAVAQDGFDREVDLLFGVDMFGRVQGARVLQDIASSGLYGMLRIIESQ